MELCLLSLMSRVFLLDGNDLTRMNLARLIEAESDLEVCGQAKGFPEALEKITQLQPECVVTHLDGFSEEPLRGIKALHQAFPRLPLVGISMADEMTQGRWWVQRGLAGYVRQAVAAQEIVPALRCVLGGGLYMQRLNPKRERGN